MSPIQSGCTPGPDSMNDIIDEFEAEWLTPCMECGRYPEDCMCPGIGQAASHCAHCHGIGPEPGWIEQDNNGPIVACPVCNPDGEKERAWRMAEMQRDLQNFKARRFSNG